MDIYALVAGIDFQEEFRRSAFTTKKTKLLIAQELLSSPTQ